MVDAEVCFGGHSGGETPGLIPNPEAKPSSADGTALGRVWESRTPPDSTLGKAHTTDGVGLFFIPPNLATSRPVHQRTGLFCYLRVCATERMSTSNLAASSTVRPGNM